MKRIILFSAFLSIVTLFSSSLPAQNHGSIGAFGSYFRENRTEANFGGLGGRLSINAHKNVQFEGEVGYDFTQAFTEGFTDTGTGTVTLVRSDLRIVHGLFGPKLQTGGGAIRAFATVKGGFINFRFDNRPATFATFTSSVENLRTGNTRGVLYPGAGVEFYAGIFGFRFDVGDEIYFQNGARHNLRITVGPHIRF